MTGAIATLPLHPLSSGMVAGGHVILEGSELSTASFADLLTSGISKLKNYTPFSPPVPLDKYRDDRLDLPSCT